ncbi:dihydroorotate dehydrogenase electron transfer subunit [Robertmurraya massiliosenegalensis]|uniref:dihydroorotate dehydrogenase electron transfer subunit n=1 Tax=Robertmurraya massiliosenegalensis TaxID=1287657 RepID=UPI00037A42CC|nr:dihydroorotate dehydrogenase electron transfer subunit [Robertmurraya massiliosenegalensis]
METNQVRILSNVKVSDRYWHMTVEAGKLNRNVKPGQFFNILCSDGVYPYLRRPLSVFRIDARNERLEFLYLVKGLGTMKMTELKQDGYIDIMGPLGNGFQVKNDETELLLLARGVGIATLTALADEAIKLNKRVFAIVSARSEKDLLAASYLSSIGVKVYKVTDEEGSSNLDYVEGLINRLLVENNIRSVYTCGSRRLSLLLQKIAKEERLRGEIALEEHMGCAMGVCFACVCQINEGTELKSARVCVEGPVFPLEKVVL